MFYHVRKYRIAIHCKLLLCSTILSNLLRHKKIYNKLSKFKDLFWSNFYVSPESCDPNAFRNQPTYCVYVPHLILTIDSRAFWAIGTAQACRHSSTKIESLQNLKKILQLNRDVKFIKLVKGYIQHLHCNICF